MANPMTRRDEWFDDHAAAYGAGTEARRDLYCVNEDAGLWWDRLDVQAHKYDGNYLCESTLRYYTTTQRSVSVSNSDICAPAISDEIHVIGVHGAARPGGGPVPVRELSLTPNVVTV